MSDNNETCPICKGVGFCGSGYYVKNEGGVRAIYPYARLCLCVINRQIGDRFKELAYLPKVSQSDAERAISTYQNKDTIFFGNLERFLYMVKCYFAGRWGHTDNMLLQSSQVVEMYHAPGKDKEWLKVSFLNRYDHVVMLFMAQINYKSLSACVAEVIKNRSMVHEPTWIYAADEKALKESKEYSKELEYYTKSYKILNIDETYDLEGYRDGISEAARQKEKTKVNQDFSNV